MLHELIEVIRHPDEDAKGYTRWWWYGCAVTREGIVTQLDAMHHAGIGGVELQILYPLHPDNPATGIRNIPYFSPEFFDLLAFTRDACAQRGMKLDVTLGSSWPFGGPFVPLELAMQCAIPYQIDVRGPCVYECDLTTRIVGEVCAAVMGRMEDCVMQPETVIDITDRFVIKLLFGWPWGTRVEPLDIPEGNWKIVFFVIHRYRQTVGKPAPNAEGYVIDHCRPDAVSCFLDNMGQPIADRLGNAGVHSFFCDSIECDGHNWSGILLEEFKKRRGYDLTPFLYALWGDLGGITPDVRHDYFLTMSELTLEHFFAAFTRWSNRNGATSRIQAHGTWADILKAYATADIPEGETFGEQDFLGCNTIHRRLASSAGHLYGKPIISNETFTWLRRPRFTETPAILKAAVDAVFLDGMNMIVNHGFPYESKGEGEFQPFYASSHLCDDLPWWPHYRHLGAYIQTVSALLRQGRHVSEVGIFLPQADVRSDNLLSDLHMAMKLEEHIGRDTADAVAKAGYWFDFLNDEALVRLGAVQDGGIRISGNLYKVIVLIGCTRMEVKTAECLFDFVQAGGTLIAAEAYPRRSCGLLDRDRKDEAVKRVLDPLFGPLVQRDPDAGRLPEGASRSGTHTGKGCAVLVPDRRDALINALHGALEPDVSISRPETVGYVHRVAGDTHIYFLANISAQSCHSTVLFRDKHTGFMVISPETGRILPLPAYEETDSGMQLTFEHPPYDSCIVLFSPDLPVEEICTAMPKTPLGTFKLEGWTCCVNTHIIHDSMPEPGTWESVPEGAHHAGEGVYSCTFGWNGGLPMNQEAWLELTNLYCAAEVRLNGRHVGDIWHAPYRLEIGSALREGMNELVLIVTNPLINRILAPTPSERPLPDVLSHWPYFGNTLNHIRKERLSFAEERDAFTTPQPSGLSGPVTIALLQRSVEIQDIPVADSEVDHDR